MSISMNKQQQDEAFLDAAAAEAIGTHGAEESDAFVRDLGRSDEAGRKVARELREAVAKMAAASPYMEPPESLRGKILAATAPQTFKLAEYRRRNEISPRWMRWGLVAAVMFLTAGAWYNTSLQNTVKLRESALAQASEQIGKNQQIIAGLQMQAEKTSLAMASLVDEGVTKIPLYDEQKNKMGVLVQDPATKTFMVVLPQKMLPPNAMAKLVLEHNGKTETIEAMAFGAAGQAVVSDKLADSLKQDGSIRLRVGEVNYASKGRN